MRGCLLALCACNSVFGLERTHLDQPPPDAHLQCPALGTAPAFTSALYQVGTKDCNQYTESRTANLAMAYCRDSSGYNVIEAGPIGGEVAPIGIAADLAIFNPRLAADGDRLTLIYAPTSGATRLEVYRRDGATWTSAPDLTIPVIAGSPISPITSGPTHRMLVYLQGALHEYDVDTGLEVGAYQQMDLGFNVIGTYTDTTLALSPDGLRLVTLVQPKVGAISIAMYTDRPSLDARFHSFVPLAGVPGAADLFMVEDCSRIYYSSDTVGAEFFAWEQPP